MLSGYLQRESNSISLPMRISLSHPTCWGQIPFTIWVIRQWAIGMWNVRRQGGIKMYRTYRKSSVRKLRIRRPRMIPPEQSVLYFVRTQEAQRSTQFCKTSSPSLSWFATFSMGKCYHQNSRRIPFRWWPNENVSPVLKTLVLIISSDNTEVLVKLPSR